MSLSATLSPPSHDALLRVRRGRRPTHAPAGPSGGPTPRTDRSVPAYRHDITSPSDEELLGRYRDARRPEDFAELLRRYAGELGRYLARYLGDAALAEDVLQDTFFQVHAKCASFRDGSAARPWLYTIAVRRAVDALRRSRRMPKIRLDRTHADDELVGSGSLGESLAGADPGPLENLLERERQHWVRESVARLPEPLRQVLVLAYYQDLSYAEIAGLLGVPLGTIKSRLHAAVAHLRAMAERYDRVGSR